MSNNPDSASPGPTNLAALQASRLREIGAYLRQVRLDQNQVIEAIAQETFIQVYQLRAIEAGDLSALPQAIYVQGFIKKFAIALGLNGKEIAAGFPTERSSK
ncbi:MAG: helix-turn-helix domain-containing protein [Leptolyngbyaceae cyanobacterium]